ncbi:unnamed protein product [Moneuplotes crassus]|uniref:Nuclear transcription factor Y subunit n=2 Tax=Euplotes crassus TaxID=5936 RepID=A0AAD1XQR9_EUPCR|nr:unnamed protein product [Moneuplotes crassus]
MSSTKKKSVFKSASKIQSTIEHFAKKVKSSKKRKEKAARKAIEESKENEVNDASELEPETMAHSTTPPKNPSPVSSFLPPRPDFLPPVMQSELMYSNPLNLHPMSGTSSQEMLASCLYYKHMYHTSLMAAKGKLPLQPRSLDEPPIYVNRKQYKRIKILREKRQKREQREEQEAPKNKNSQCKIKYESRVKHANRRPRDRNGRFYKKGEAPGEKPEESSQKDREKLSEKSKDITKTSNE